MVEDSIDHVFGMIKATSTRVFSESDVEMEQIDPKEFEGYTFEGEIWCCAVYLEVIGAF